MKKLTLLTISLVFVSSPLLARSLGDVGNKKTNPADQEEFFGGIFRYGGGIDYMTIAPSESGQFESGEGPAAHISMDFSSRYGIDVSYGQYTQKVKSTQQISSGEVTVKPLQFNILYYFLGRQSFTPFVQGGFGYYDITYKRDPGVVLLPGYDISERIKGETGYHFGAGFKYFLTRSYKFSLNADYSYLSLKADNQIVYTFSGNQYAYSRYGLEMGGNRFNIGCTYYF